MRVYICVICTCVYVCLCVYACVYIRDMYAHISELMLSILQLHVHVFVCMHVCICM